MRRVPLCVKPHAWISQSSSPSQLPGRGIAWSAFGDEGGLSAAAAPHPQPTRDGAGGAPGKPSGAGRVPAFGWLRCFLFLSLRARPCLQKERPALGDKRSLRRRLRSLPGRVSEEAQGTVKARRDLQQAAPPSPSRALAFKAAPLRGQTLGGASRAVGRRDGPGVRDRLARAPHEGPAHSRVPSGAKRGMCRGRPPCPPSAAQTAPWAGCPEDCAGRGLRRRDSPYACCAAPAGSPPFSPACRPVCALCPVPRAPMCPCTREAGVTGKQASGSTALVLGSGRVAAV